MSHGLHYCFDLCGIFVSGSDVYLLTERNASALEASFLKLVPAEDGTFSTERVLYSVGTSVTLADGSSGYAVRIYLKDGMLLEDYAAADAVLHPEEAQQIGMTEQFEAEKLSGDLLRLKTDAGSVLLHLRSGGDGR